MSTEGIKKFWRWWPKVRPRVEAAISGAGFDPDLVEEINDHVSAVDERLDWELAPGVRGAAHAFCVSPKGDPELRLLTELWRVSGPPADATWEYHGARQGGPVRAGMQLQIDGVDVSAADFSVAFEVDRTRERIDARYFHPAFAKRPPLEDKLRFTITYLVADAMFGEDGVERWLGVIEPVNARPADAQPMSALQAAVDELTRSATGEKFALLRGEDGEGKPVFATINLAVKRVDHLLCTMHVAVDIEIADPDENGLSKTEEAPALDELEVELTTALGPGAVFVGRETRRGRRVLHWFTPEDGPQRSAIEAWTASHPERGVQATWTRDPGWTLLQRFT